MSFGDSVKLNCEKILREINNKCYSITWGLFTTVVKNTPVLDGELINNWFPQVGDGYSFEKTSSQSKTGSGSLSRINSLPKQSLFYDRDNVVSMSNNQSYAMNAEYLGWPSPKWSGKVGPYRMIGLSLIKVAAENR